MSNKWERRIGWLICLIGIVIVNTHNVRTAIGIGFVTLGAMFIESSKYNKDKTTK